MAAYLWVTSPAGWLPRTRISSRTLCSVIEYGLAFYSKLNKARDGGLTLDQRWQGTDKRRENSSTYRSDRARFRECELACEQVRTQPTTRHQHSPPEHHCHSLIRWRTSLSLTHHCNKHNCIAALLLPSVLWRCWLGGNNHNKSLKRWHCLPSHRLIVNMMLSNITFLMIFAVFGPSPLTLCLNCTRAHTRTHTHTHTHTFNGHFSIWISLKQETLSGNGISWAICKSAPCSRQTTTPAPHHSVFYRPDALPAAQPTASKHWRKCLNCSF